MEVLEFIRETYWSEDFLVEIDGYKKIAKFVDKHLIQNHANAILLSELSRNVNGLLVPESFDFEGNERYVLVYDIPSYKSIEDISEEEREGLMPHLLYTLRSVLHIPGLIVPILGKDDVVFVNDEPRIFLPVIQPDSEFFASSKRRFFVAPEYFNNKLSDKSTLYVFGHIMNDLTNNLELKETVKKMICESPDERIYLSELAFQSMITPHSKKLLIVKRIVRNEENEIINLVLNKEVKSNFIGVIGPQRVGKTTMIENIQSCFRQNGIPFLHVTSGGDLIVQALQITSDRISQGLLSKLSYCLENVCKIDTVSLDIVEALHTLDKVVIFTDDYQEADESLKTFLKRISKLDNTGIIKILAFSVEDFEDFNIRVEIKSFTKEMIRDLLQKSFSKVENEDLFVEWLYTVSNGLPGIIVEYLKYLYENDIFRKDKGMYVVDIEKLVDVNISRGFLDKIELLTKSKQKYLAVLGQKFTTAEVAVLEQLINEKIDLSEFFERGVIYKEYNRIRFTLKQYWEFLYESIDNKEREEIHKKLSEVLDDYEKKAWHLEFSGKRLSAAVVYLKYAKYLIEYYSSSSVIESILRKVKTIIGSRESYALAKFYLELAERTEDSSYLENFDLPEKKIYVYFQALKHYILYEYDEAIEILSRQSIDFGKIGNLRRELLLLKSEFEKKPGRKDYYERAKKIISNLDETKPQHARILVDCYIFLALITRMDHNRSIEFLRKAEKIALEFNIAHKLPSIYNNLAVEISNTTIAMEYLNRAVEIAEDIGLPARSYLSKLNMLYHALYAGKISDFIKGIMQLRPKIELLGLRHELIYSLSLEAYYHAYNFEIEEAVEHINEAKNKFGVGLADEFFSVYFITRDIDKAFNFLNDVLESQDIGEGVKEAIKVISYFGTEYLPIKWQYYLNSGGRIFREEMVAVLGMELAKSVPETFRKELEYLEGSFVLEGSTLSLAMVYEGYGHYYKVIGNNYKSKVYYSKAITLYRDMGLKNAVKHLSEIYGIDLANVTEDYETVKSIRTLSYDILSSLKAIDPKTEPDKLLNYFASKILSVIPAKNLMLKVSDDILEKNYEISIGTFESEKPTSSIFSVSPLEIFITDKIDRKAKYELWLSNKNVKFPETYKQTLLPILETIEYSMIAILKGSLTRLRSLVDPLTKLYTRYYFADILSHYFERASAEHSELTVAMCDIDNFKKINDTYGHLTGDEVLKEIAKVFRENVRTTDIVGRFGGEEFILLFPSTGKEEAVLILERLRRLLRDVSKFPFKITLSYGISNYPYCGATIPDELIQKADIALYQAKNTGKDKIVIYTEGMSGGLHA